MGDPVEKPGKIFMVGKVGPRIEESDLSIERGLIANRNSGCVSSIKIHYSESFPVDKIEVGEDDEVLIFGDGRWFLINPEDTSGYKNVSIALQEGGREGEVSTITMHLETSHEVVKDQGEMHPHADCPFCGSSLEDAVR